MLLNKKLIFSWAAGGDICSLLPWRNSKAYIFMEIILNFMILQYKFANSFHIPRTKGKLHSALILWMKLDGILEFPRNHLIERHFWSNGNDRRVRIFSKRLIQIIKNLWAFSEDIHILSLPRTFYLFANLTSVKT